jgi:hypothetical protein
MEPMQSDHNKKLISLIMITLSSLHCTSKGKSSIKSTLRVLTYRTEVGICISNDKQQNCRELLTLSKTVKDNRKMNEDHFVECTFGMFPMNPKDWGGGASDVSGMKEWTEGWLWPMLDQVKF